KVFTAENGEQGLKLVEKSGPDIVFVDKHLPGKRGLEFITQIKSSSGDTNIVFITAYEDIDAAGGAIKMGAFEYIRKPFSFDDINKIVNSISEKINLKNELLLLRRQQKKKITFQHIIYGSVIMNELVQVSKKIAQTDATTILLLGESGTGKDVFARAIHNESSRNTKPFVTINCSTLADTLLESELFGHEKGAFTDAKKMKKGLFEIAEGGTVFLDEIGEISLSTQVKLLGVLENRTILRLGSTVETPVDVRIIAATNKNLMESIADKTFREDFYYRLQVFQIEIPSLRERKEDISLLLDYFIALFNKMFRKKITSVSLKTKNLLERYNWPGNVRELRNVVERAVILQNGTTLETSSLPCEISNIKQHQIVNTGYFFDFPDEGISLDMLEKQVIKQALEMADFNQTQASRLLGISRDTLRYKKKKHNL
ncbi:MAG: sigma-54 dependent transcriptional regulator, partial [Bacteroidales bacterium]|nr:sigma-54 dependent transcriptional regulator [Bacteroidales bacterium]